MCPHNSGMERVGFSKKDARGNLIVASLPVNFPLPAFSPKVSGPNVHWTDANHTFLTH
jgi:hypothetical protein